jgi:hypothetical protein
MTGQLEKCYGPSGSKEDDDHGRTAAPAGVVSTLSPSCAAPLPPLRNIAHKCCQRDD